MTTRNSKGQFAPKKPKKPTQLDRIESMLSTLLSGSSFMQELGEHKAQAEEPKAEPSLRSERELEGSKTKELTDEVAMEIARNYGPKHGESAGPNMDVFDALRYARDNGYLSTSPATLSKDYPALYDHLVGGGEALGIVEGSDGMMDAVRVYSAEGRLIIANNNSCHSIYVARNRDGFIRSCTRLNLSYVLIQGKE